MPRDEQYWNRRKRNLCVECPNPTQGFARCPACLAKRQAAKSNSADSKYGAGRCIHESSYSRAGMTARANTPVVRRGLPMWVLVRGGEVISDEFQAASEKAAQKIADKYGATAVRA